MAAKICCPRTTRRTICPRTPALVLGAVFLVLQWGMTWAVSRWYAFGYSAVVIASFIFIALGHSSTWNHIAGTIVP